MEKPRHIAIIMDGNGRWAKKHLMRREAGHRAGAQALRRLVEDMDAEGYETLTVFAFSTENWKRDEEEVSYLMSLIHEYIQQYIDESDKGNGRVKVIGDLSVLEASLLEKIAYLEQITEEKTGILLNLAINYGGRNEILRAVKCLTKDVIAGKISPEGIDEVDISSRLDTALLPNPDLIIRTSGEMRLSNFLLWQAAYAEFYCTDVLWPDFKMKHLNEAVKNFQKRQRRYGGR